MRLRRTGILDKPLGRTLHFLVQDIVDNTFLVFFQKIDKRCGIRSSDGHDYLSRCVLVEFGRKFGNAVNG